ncbi:hypothetical protein ONZ45_g12103 [Pleurotus djamor]|nr:hypothetical protein ONZ45_g12103 [Pleurotus djamor]
MVGWHFSRGWEVAVPWSDQLPDPMAYGKPTRSTKQSIHETRRHWCLVVASAVLTSSISAVIVITTSHQALALSRSMTKLIAITLFYAHSHADVHVL